MLKVIALLTSLLLFLFDPTTCGNQGSDTELSPKTIYDCDDPGYLNFSMILITNDNDEKALDLIADLEESLDNDFLVTVKVDSKTNDGWKEDIYNRQAGMCDFLLKHASKAWENLKNKANPVLENECEVEPGHHEVHDWQVKPTDTDITGVPVGTYKTTITVFNSREELALCRIMEIEVVPKEADGV